MSHSEDSSFIRFPAYVQGSREAAEFELRVNRRTNIFYEMLRISPTMALTQTSLLVGIEDGQVKPLGTYSNKRLTLYNSPMYKAHRGIGNYNLVIQTIPKEEYDRLEGAYQGFTAALCLAVKDLDQPGLLDACWELKKWCYRNANNVDHVTKYLKYLIKVSQAAFLRTQFPETEEGWPRETIYGKIADLQFIEAIRLEGIRKRPLTVRQAYVLGQLSQGSRIGPYPSHDQVTESIEQSISYMLRETKLSEKVRQGHRAGLNAILARLHMPDIKHTHVSFQGSGCLENPRSEGGKASYLLEFAREIAERPILKISDVEEVSFLVDVFGFSPIEREVLPPLQVALGEHPVKWGQVLYTPLLEVSNQLDNELVPYGLAKIILLICSAMMEEYGYYDRPKANNVLMVPLFHPKSMPVHHVPTVDAIPVSASVSVEAALKSRLVTAAPAAFTQIGQLINNFMRSWLSRDPFTRVGFEEPDKLWEVLKSYKKEYERTHGL